MVVLAAGLVLYWTCKKVRKHILPSNDIIFIVSVVCTDDDVLTQTGTRTDVVLSNLHTVSTVYLPY